MILKNLRELSIFILILTGLSCATSRTEYHGIVREIKRGELDFAFLKLKDYLKEHPESTYVPRVRFAICEYYFQRKNYRNAIEELYKYIVDYPEDKSAVFTQAILYKILLEYRDESPLLEKLRKIFFSKYLFLVFSEAKIKHYRSIMNNTYKIVEYIDRMEFYKNNELFFKIAP